MKPTQHDVNIFMDIVRASGRINVFGAAPYIQEHFEVTRKESKLFLYKWMETFCERKAKGEVVA